ncbi:unnamed protein product [Didymodactylos carnosus]|uniref:Uncharacterized protein n=1 Tax=Didymodactylos carnosus TaxID=1234261 RepID=A0A8S2ETW4_9BILA|nr:unnamed protein product [Didymodactylos carnosus]CAF4045631.1 unnamed protein product [Didymodactylos carnosus]
MTETSSTNSETGDTDLLDRQYTTFSKRLKNYKEIEEKHQKDIQELHIDYELKLKKQTEIIQNLEENMHQIKQEKEELLEKLKEFQISTSTTTGFHEQVKTIEIEDKIFVERSLFDRISVGYASLLDDVKNLENACANLNVIIDDRDQEIEHLKLNLNNYKKQQNGDSDQIILFQDLLNKEVEKIVQIFNKRLLKTRTDFEHLYSKQVTYMKRKLDLLKDGQTLNYENFLAKTLEN